MSLITTDTAPKNVSEYVYFDAASGHSHVVVRWFTTYGARVIYFNVDWEMAPDDDFDPTSITYKAAQNAALLPAGYVLP